MASLPIQPLSRLDGPPSLAVDTATTVQALARLLTRASEMHALSAGSGNQSVQANLDAPAGELSARNAAALAALLVASEGDADVAAAKLAAVFSKASRGANTTATSNAGAARSGTNGAQTMQNAAVALLNTPAETDHVSLSGAHVSNNPVANPAIAKGPNSTSPGGSSNAANTTGAGNGAAIANPQGEADSLANVLAALARAGDLSPLIQLDLDSPILMQLLAPETSSLPNANARQLLPGTSIIAANASQGSNGAANLAATWANEGSQSEALHALLSLVGSASANASPESSSPAGSQNSFAPNTQSASGAVEILGQVLDRAAFVARTLAGAGAYESQPLTNPRASVTPAAARLNSNTLPSVDLPPTATTRSETAPPSTTSRPSTAQISDLLQAMHPLLSERSVAPVAGWMRTLGSVLQAADGTTASGSPTQGEQGRPAGPINVNSLNAQPATAPSNSGPLRPLVIAFTTPQARADAEALLQSAALPGVRWEIDTAQPEKLALTFVPTAASAKDEIAINSRAAASNPAIAKSASEQASNTPKPVQRSGANIDPDLNAPHPNGNSTADGAARRAETAHTTASVAHGASSTSGSNPPNGARDTLAPLQFERIALAAHSDNAASRGGSPQHSSATAIADASPNANANAMAAHPYMMPPVIPMIAPQVHAKTRRIDEEIGNDDSANENKHASSESADNTTGGALLTPLEAPGAKALLLLEHHPYQLPMRFADARAWGLVE